MPVTTRNAAARAQEKTVQKHKKVQKQKKAQKTNMTKVKKPAKKQTAEKAQKTNMSKVKKTVKRQTAEKAQLYENAYKSVLDMFEHHAKHPRRDNPGVILPGEGDEFSGWPPKDGVESDEYRGGGVIGEMFFLERTDGTLEPVADSAVFPPYHPSLIQAPEELYADAVFVKRPNWLYFAHPDACSNPFPASMMLGEAAVLTTLAKHPHPHIARFLGCRVRRGRITGLVMERLPVTLADADPGLFAKVAANKDRFFAQLRSAVAHLHALGLTHNDIKPNNVMLRPDGQPVLIDFDTCLPIGAPAFCIGTFAWCRPVQFRRLQEGKPVFAEPENDAHSLKCLEERFMLPGCGMRTSESSSEAGSDIAIQDETAGAGGDGSGRG